MMHYSCKFISAIILNAAFFISAHAQNQISIDSLLKMLKGAVEDTSKLNTLFLLSDEYYHAGDQENEIKFTGNALQLARKINYKKGEAKANLLIGGIYRSQGKYAEALKSFYAGMKINKEIGNRQGIAASYNNIGLVYSDQGNFSEALKNYFSSLKISEEAGNKTEMADSYSNIGIAYDYQGNYPEALKNYLSSLNIYKEIGDKPGTAGCYNNIALIFFYQGNYPEALKYHFEALKIFEALGEKSGVAMCYMNIGIIYIKQDNQAEALKNMFAALKINEDIGERREASNCYINIGGIYVKMENYPEALKNYFAGLKIREEIGDKSGIATAYLGVGRVYRKQGDYTNALKNYFTALKITEETGDRNMMASCYNSIGVVYSQKGQYSLAIDYLNKGLDLAKTIGSKDVIKSCYDDFSNVYEKMKDWKNAFRFQKLYFQMNDSIYNETKSKQLIEMKTKYESEAKENEITLLNKEKVIQSSEIRKQTLLKNFFVGGLALALVLFFLIYNNYRTRQKLKLETIRNNIAADLHDDIGSTLNSISLFSEVAKQEAGKPIPALDQIGVSARKIIDAMSDIVWTINPENDTFENVVARMRSLAYLTMKAKGIEMVFKADENLNNLSLPILVRKNIYLLFKEAANNIVKYSKASRASFHLSLENKIVKMAIRDNGVGFDVDNALMGNGIKNMKRRATEIAGQFLIESSEGNGTNIELNFKV